MGILDWLKGSKSNVEEVEDFIWITATAKIAGVIQSVHEALNVPDGPTVVLVVSHFKDCQAEIQQSLEANAVDDPRVFALQADDLETVKNSLLGLDSSQLVEMIVAERHPLVECDGRLVEFARECGCRFRITHHLSLDDPLLRIFAGDWVRSILERLGMKEEEAIRSRMVSRRIRAAQEKLTRNADGELVMESAEAWFERNVK